jgi:hypothetical protein
MVATLATLGEIVEEQKVMEKILHCVPPRLKQIALTISTLLDVESLTVANLVGQFKAAEEAFAEPLLSLQHDGKLYLTKEEWDVRRVRREFENPRAGGFGVSGDKAGRGGGRGDHGHGRGHGRGCGHGTGSKGCVPQKTDKCHRCGKLGYWAHECRSNAKKD